MDATFFKGRENSALMTLTNNGAPVLPANITKVEFRYGAWSINSDEHAGLFAFETTGVRLKFGGCDLAAGKYLMTVVVYSADHVAGIVWKTNAEIEIIQL